MLRNWSNRSRDFWFNLTWRSEIKKKANIALPGNPISELRDVTCHMGSHSVTCHPTQVNVPILTPARQAGTWLTYPGGMEGWVDLIDLIAPRLGVEPATFRSRVRRRIAAPPRQPNLYAGNFVFYAGNLVQVSCKVCWSCVKGYDIDMLLICKAR